ncbi:N-acetyl-gamma-glutamyl-phosphate reductase [Basilea psittacipulmonis]|uniref:N-acetyl-gamma-glutamyl-phosphate reductase n=1 Tax=Basilea psittacipulmonis DSM 24701 TaxID=1072685 RepID=A0A077DCN9_9BURK|nr:N-acetyl-gamma-glutamyl-phosphate reductase [Basilea psittacipulmonis]AIL32369.1 N-acetyl-gamma-glutamyl-phosphate reductase [Basilea psittacipulmonis DSM 24701]
MIKVGVVGATGYTGVELLRILSQHPEAEIKAVTSRSEEGMLVSDMFPNLRKNLDLKFTTPEHANLEDCDVVFFATPHGVAMSQAASLLKAGVKIIDLAADFRLQDTDAFKKWYQQDHVCPDILKNESVYGLVEKNRERIKQKKVIGNPGCYPTTVILGLMPLLEQSWIETQGIIADCKSGVSGAGRKASVGTLLAEASDNFKAYAVSGHRHHPEIVEQLNEIAGESVGLTFIPHLVPMIRGMFSTLYVRLKAGHTLEEVHQMYQQRYQHETFIDVLPLGALPETRWVRASNMLRIGMYIAPHDPQQLILLVVQDNLLKGAAGQAVQNMNVMFGLKEDTGLGQMAILP